MAILAINLKILGLVFDLPVLYLLHADAIIAHGIPMNILEPNIPPMANTKSLPIYSFLLDWLIVNIGLKYKYRKQESKNY